MKDKDRDMHTRINYRHALKKWASVASLSLRENAGKRNYNFKRSISHKAMFLKDVKEFTFKYYLYAMFVDMNVGKGRPLGANREAAIVNALTGTKRKRKSKKQYMWYTKPMWRHVKILGNIVQAEYGDLGVNAAMLPQLIELTFDN